MELINGSGAFSQYVEVRVTLHVTIHFFVVIWKKNCMMILESKPHSSGPLCEYSVKYRPLVETKPGDGFLSILTRTGGSVRMSGFTLTDYFLSTSLPVLEKILTEASKRREESACAAERRCEI